MKKLLLVFIMMATWMVVGCETVRQVKAGCFGFWMEAADGSRSGYKRGTRWSNRDNVQPYRQCVDQERPHLNLEKRPYG
jgi:uncharacterized protein YceK